VAWSKANDITLANSTGSSVALAPTATTRGNLVVLAIGISALTETITSVTDGAGNNTWNLVGPIDNVIRCYLAYAVQETGGVTSITINASGAIATKIGGGAEFTSSLGTIDPNATIFELSGNGTGTSTAPACGAFTPAATGDLIVASILIPASRTFTAGTNYVLGGAFGTGILAMEYRLAGTQSETAPASFSSTALTWAEVAAAFKEIIEGKSPHPMLLGVG
jgi:hypothetical protein